MSSTITDPMYAFHYIGRPASESAQLKTLGFDGPLVVASDHKMAVMLPDALDDAPTAGEKIVPMSRMHGGMTEAYIYDNDIRKGGMHMVITLSRSATMVKDMDEHGMDWTPIYGDATVAWPKAIARMVATMKTMSDAQRTILFGDVIYHSAHWDNAGTDTWYDWMNPDVLMANGGGMKAVQQFANITPACYNNTADHDGRASEDFKSLLLQISMSVGRDISAMPQQSQAAAVAKWIRKTARPTPYTLHVSAQDAVTEVERRAGATEAER